MRETFILVRKQRQEKRNHNKEQSTNLLKQAEISFESKNSGNHLIILSTPKIDFYPSTGLWKVRGENRSRRGVKNLLKYLSE
ncbi:hypothetical protein [Neisseria elongata]|uniref:hypothetical protein n=1 Tax=Neisseria elongata TaxID=495 RepID=UPI001959CED7|nr:hypothetical protein [Neisseria elongata]MBM7064310.1 hypothetical protein [Neisseria elongata]